MHSLDATQTAAALPYPALIDALERTFLEGVDAPERAHHSVPLPGGGTPNTLILMPAWRAGEHVGVKIVTVAPENRSRGRPAVTATYLLLDAETGELRWLLDGAEMTARRTAAVSALAARRLAPETARAHLIVGAGAVAAQLARAHRCVRNIEETLVWARRTQAAEELAAELRQEGLAARAVPDLERAAGAADIVSCATLAETPVVRGEWLAPACHLDLVGSYRPHMREADDAAFAGAVVYVDALPGALTDTGELRAPLASGALQRSQLAGDLAALLRAPGEARPASRTIFKSVGTAVADYAAARLAAERLRSRAGGAAPAGPE